MKFIAFLTVLFLILSTSTLALSDWPWARNTTYIGAYGVKNASFIDTLTITSNGDLILSSGILQNLTWQGTVIGDAYISSASNWNLAYAWGDHSLLGYLTSASNLNASKLNTGTVNNARLDSDVVFESELSTGLAAQDDCDEITGCLNSSEINATIAALDTDTYNTSAQMVAAVNTTGYLINWSGEFADTNCSGNGSCALIVYDDDTTGWDKDGSDDFDGAWGSLTSVPAGFADNVDNNTQLSDAQVQNIISTQDAYLSNTGDTGTGTYNFIKSSASGNGAVINLRKDTTNTGDYTGIRAAVTTSEDHYKSGILWERVSAVSTSLHLVNSENGTTGHTSTPADAALTVRPNKNVGIGTQFPNATLHVVGSMFLNSSSVCTAANGLCNQSGGTGNVTSQSGVNNQVAVFTNGTNIDSSSSLTSDGTTVRIDVGSGTTPFEIEAGGRHIQFQNATGTDKWHLEYYQGGLGFTESGVASGRLFLKDGGQVGIGTSSPDAELDVEGATTLLNDLRFTESSSINFIQSGANRASSSWQELRITPYQTSTWNFRITSAENVEIANNLTVSGDAVITGSLTADLTGNADTATTASYLSGNINSSQIINTPAACSTLGDLYFMDKFNGSTSDCVELNQSLLNVTQMIGYTDPSGYLLSTGDSATGGYVFNHPTFNISGGTGPATLNIIADSDNSNENDVASIKLNQDGGAVNGYIGFSTASDNNFYLLNQFGGNLYLGTDNYVRATISSSGHFGLRETSPDARFELSALGSTAFPIFMISSDDAGNGDIILVNGSGTATYSGSELCTPENGLCNQTDTDTTYTANDIGLNLTGTVFGINFPTDCSDEASTLLWSPTTGFSCGADAGAGGGMTSWTLSNGTTTATVNDGERINITGGTGIYVSQVGEELTINNLLTDTNTEYSVGAGLVVSANGTEFNHSDTSSQSSSDNSGRTYIQDVILDTYGHITSLVTATETVVDTDTNESTRVNAITADCPAGQVVQNITDGGLECVTNEDTDTQLSEEQVEDFVGGMLGGTETRISVTYDDAGNAINFVVDDMNDDVPESGDFGNAADLESTGALSTGVVSDNEIDYTTVTLNDFTNDAGLLTNNSNANFNVLKAQDWSNVTILENQISDLSHTVDTYNTSAQMVAAVDTAYPNLDTDSTNDYTDADIDGTESAFNGWDKDSSDDVTVGLAANNYIGVFTNSTNIAGTSGFAWDGAQLTLGAAGNPNIRLVDTGDSTNIIGTHANIMKAVFQKEFQIRGGGTSITTGTPIIHITNTSLVGINTTAPNKTLHVVGDAEVTGTISMGGNTVCTTANGLCNQTNSSAQMVAAVDTAYPNLDTDSTNDYTVGGTDVALADGGTGASLTDPNADRIMFWDESANSVGFLTASTGLTISTTSMTVRAASTSQTGIAETATAAEVTTGTDTLRYITPSSLTSITRLGTITTGTWQGTEIADAYVSDTLTASNLVAGSEVVSDAEVVDTITISSGGSVDLMALTQGGASTGEVLKWNGSDWSPATDNTGASGGDSNNAAGWSNETLTTHSTTALDVRVESATPEIELHDTDSPSNSNWSISTASNGQLFYITTPNGANSMIGNRDTAGWTIQNIIGLASYSGVQALVARGASSQTTDIFVVENSGGTDYFTVNGTGTAFANRNISVTGVVNVTTTNADECLLAGPYGCAIKQNSTHTTLT